MNKEFNELYKKYGFDNPNKSRDDLSEDEERNFINDWFDIYEHIGFANTFKNSNGYVSINLFF